MQSIIPRFEWWFRLTTPPLPSSSADFRVREIARRARVTSTVVLVTILLLLTTFAVRPNLPHPVMMYVVLASVLSIDIVALIYNRKGRLLVAGCLVTCATQAGLCLDFLGQIVQHQGLDVSMLPLFGMLIQPILIAVSVLPARVVFLVCPFNCAFVILCIIFAPHLPSLDLYIKEHGLVLLLQVPLILYIMCSTISYIWVRSTLHALRVNDLVAAQTEFEFYMAKQNARPTQQNEIMPYRSFDHPIDSE